MRPSLLCVLIPSLVLLAAACSGGASGPPRSTELAESTASPGPSPIRTPSLEPPVSDLPAAGICAEPSGDVVTIAVEPDIPSPRCSRVTSSQRLRVVNKTSEEIDVQIADFKMRLGAGDEESVDAPFGS